jgi:hypothetical protein
VARGPSRELCVLSLDSESKGIKVDRMTMFTIRVAALALLAIGWARMERALHADALVSSLLFVPLVFLGVIFWRTTAR